MQKEQLKIAVCDDEQSDREQVISMTAEYLRSAGLSHNITEYACGKNLLEALSGGEQFHIMLLDVMMGDMNGIELARQLKDRANRAAIVFISGNREMALYGYEVSAQRYLAKPVDQSKLNEALQHCCAAWQKKKEILVTGIDKGQCRISLEDIQLVEAFERGSRFVLADETLDTKLKISEVEAMLPKSSFVQCHRAYVVNITHIKRLRANEFELRSGLVVPISKYRYEAVSKKFFEYFSD